MRRVALCRALETPLTFGAHMGLSHQSNHTFAAAIQSFLLEPSMDLGTAVDAPTGSMNGFDAPLQHLVCFCSTTQRPATPGVIAARRHAQRLTHQHDGIALPVAIDESKLQRVGCAKTLSAFFRMSRSRRVCSSSRRRRINSASPGLRVPLPGKAEPPACRCSARQR